MYGRSNGNGIATSGTASAATSNFNVTYTGAWSRSDNYKDGNGDEVKSSLYQAQNHMLSLAARKNGDLFVLDAGVQHIPYQGFVNQYMDMTDNTAWFVNGRYAGEFGWGKLDVRAFYQNTQHEMNFLKDKGGSATGGMPMLTDGTNAGYSVKAEIPLNRRDTIRVGNEFHAFMLDDWWPPVAGKPGMCCETFWNINGGERDQLGTFLEWEAKWSQQWTTLLGGRNDVVWMDTGNVKGYNTWQGSMPRNYIYDANAFNAKDHQRTDVNFDVTALTRYEPNSKTTLEAGYAMKTRSPNLYERYAWSSSMMGLKMNGWFGDGNGYIGNLDLKPETAHTFSVTAGWHDSARKEWELKVTPYYTHVVDYVDVNRCYFPTNPNSNAGMNATCGAANRTKTNSFVYLQFANHDAEIFGADVSARMPLGYSRTFGRFGLAGILGVVHGTNLDTGDNLYRMMPINAKLTLDHKLGNWSNAVELQLVGDKDDVQQARNEVPTPGYALVNLRSSYQWGQFRLDAGVENVFDKQYYSPMGGAYLGDTAHRAWGQEVPGMGRSFYAGLTVKF